MNTVWSWGGCEYDFDVSDAACAEALAKAVGNMGGAEYTDGAGVAELIRIHCRLISGFFDTLFGEGAGETICGKAKNARLYSEAYIDFICFVNYQISSMMKLKNETEERYLRRIAVCTGCLGNEAEACGTAVMRMEKADNQMGLETQVGLEVQAEPEKTAMMWEKEEREKLA